MGEGIPTGEGSDSGDLGSVLETAQGRDENPTTPEETQKLGLAFARTIRHFFPELPTWLREVADPRDPNRIVYPAPFLLWTALSLFVLHLGSRRQIRFDLHTAAMLENLNRLAKTKVERVEHPGTLGYFCMRLPETELPLLLQRMVRHLIRMKVLDAGRFQGYFLIAVDGTGYLTFRARHCPQCLERKAGLRPRRGDKTIYYYHPVLEAKLVTASGLAISLGVTEFIENVDPQATKQDCELKAFYRLAPKLKAAFPQLRIALLLDGLFLGEPVLSICTRYDWRYVITFKEGSAPAVWQEYQALKSLSPENRLQTDDPKKGPQRWAWVEAIEYETHRVNVLEDRETGPDGKEKCFVWWTDFPLSKETVATVGNDAGRLRWKIENEGFNAQKNGGYNLEHMYAKNWNAAKNFYVFIQIGHLLHQLLEKGSLIRKTVGKKVKEAFGSIRAFTRRLLESLRYWLLPLDPWDMDPNDRIQIRLDSS